MTSCVGEPRSFARWAGMLLAACGLLSCGPKPDSGKSTRDPLSGQTLFLDDFQTGTLSPTLWDFSSAGWVVDTVSGKPKPGMRTDPGGHGGPVGTMLIKQKFDGTQGLIVKADLMMETRSVDGSGAALELTSKDGHITSLTHYRGGGPAGTRGVYFKLQTDTDHRELDGYAAVADDAEFHSVALVLGADHTLEFFLEGTLRVGNYAPASDWSEVTVRVTGPVVLQHSARADNVAVLKPH